MARLTAGFPTYARLPKSTGQTRLVDQRTRQRSFKGAVLPAPAESGLADPLDLLR